MTNQCINDDVGTTTTRHDNMTTPAAFSRSLQMAPLGARAKALNTPAPSMAAPGTPGPHIAAPGTPGPHIAAPSTPAPKPCSPRTPPAPVETQGEDAQVDDASSDLSSSPPWKKQRSKDEDPKKASAKRKSAPRKSAQKKPPAEDILIYLNVRLQARRYFDSPAPASTITWQ